MERKLASIQVISDLKPIPGADAILCAKVLGWECVVKKSEFDKPGVLCVYFEIDSVLPIAPWNAHLRKEPDKKLRVKTIRLRGQLSQGLALPLSIVGLESLWAVGPFKEGDDVTAILGVEKYEPYIPAELHGKVKGTRPSWIPKTDEPRLQSAPDALDEIKTMGDVVGTVKMDGSSITCYIKDNVFGITSRNMELLETPDNAYWKTARELQVEEAMRKHFPCGPGGGNYAIQGELCGPGIQGNRMGLDKLSIFWYNVYHIDAGIYMSHQTLFDFCLSTGQNWCEVVFQGKMPADATVQTLLDMANELKYKNKLPAEGIVWRPVKEQYSQVLKGRMSFKTISNTFLERYKE